MLNYENDRLGLRVAHANFLSGGVGFASVNPGSRIYCGVINDKEIDLLVMG